MEIFYHFGRLAGRLAACAKDGAPLTPAAVGAALAVSAAAIILCRIVEAAATLALYAAFGAGAALAVVSLVRHVGEARREV